MTDFEVRGTLNIVEACANSSVKRLVLTSSLSAMVWDQQRHAEKVIDEKCWSNLDFCRSKKLWGPLAKTMTEKAAWSLARDKELDMVVINPAIVLGPKVFGTTQSIFTYLKGNNSQMHSLIHSTTRLVEVTGTERVSASVRCEGVATKWPVRICACGGCCRGSRSSI